LSKINLRGQTINELYHHKYGFGEDFEVTKMKLGQSNRIIGPSSHDEFPNEMKIM
jgi:hypothetical protein